MLLPKVVNSKQLNRAVNSHLIIAVQVNSSKACLKTSWRLTDMFTDFCVACGRAADVT